MIVSALVSLVACTASPSAPPQAAKPAPTRAASTGSSAASAKPTASPGAVAQASPAPSPGSVGSVEILDATLADATPWVSLRNLSGEGVIVTGWRLEVGDQGVMIPENAIVPAGETLTLHADEGETSDREIHLGAASEPLALAAAPGARVRLLDPSGQVVAETTVPRY